jgi:hypothetical protein
MPQDPDTDLVIDPEHRSVGMILKTRRQSHQVGLSDLRFELPRRALADVAGAESLPRPPVGAVRVWYSALIRAVANKASWQKQTYAERNQWYSTTMDRRLTDVANTRAQRVLWWWGQVKAVAPRGAWCYVCNEMIHTYDVSSMMSHAARVSVMSHRAFHVQALVLDDDTKKAEARK